MCRQGKSFGSLSCKFSLQTPQAFNIATKSLSVLCASILTVRSFQNDVGIPQKYFLLSEIQTRLAFGEISAILSRRKFPTFADQFRKVLDYKGSSQSSADLSKQ